jgi:hypothetical protein
MDEAKVIWSGSSSGCTINSMAMTYRVSATLDAKSEAALKRIMKRTGWNKSQVIRWAIVAYAASMGPAKRPATPPRAVMKLKSKS